MERGQVYVIPVVQYEIGPGWTGSSGRHALEGAWVQIMSVTVAISRVDPVLHRLSHLSLSQHLRTGK
ncbi:hypothetical protein J6590_076226 [Homalodisca vitripennis]|nr:hypothetical protein J6590_076226 [Homalodisca vitripennis]